MLLRSAEKRTFEAGVATTASFLHGQGSRWVLKNVFVRVRSVQLSWREEGDAMGYLELWEKDRRR